MTWKYPCDPCDITANADSVTRQKHKVSNPMDDTWSFQLHVNGTKVGKKGWSTNVKGKTITGSYGVPQTIADLKDFSVLTLIVSDAEQMGCERPITIDPPGKLPRCKISAQYFDLKQPTNKVLDPNGGAWSFNLLVNGENKGKKGWTTIVNGQNLTGKYDVAKHVLVLKYVPVLNLIISDIENPDCSTSLPVKPDEPPVPCKLKVALFDKIAHSNKAYDPKKDDTWSFQLIVEGDNNGKNGWVSFVNGKSISGIYGLPKQVAELTAFSPITVTITDAEKSGCMTSITIDPPPQPQPVPHQPPPTGGTSSYCNNLKNCYHVDGFSLGQIPNRDIILFYDSPSDVRRQKKFFKQYHTKKGWITVPEEKAACSQVEASVLKSAIIADSLRMAYYKLPPKGILQNGALQDLALITMPIENGKLMCSNIKSRKIKDGDPLLKQ